jgi:hypothetical protein
MQPWFKLKSSNRERVYGWFGETLREAAVLIFVFIVAEKCLASAIALSLAWKIFCASVVLYCIGLKFGLADSK